MNFNLSNKQVLAILAFVAVFSAVFSAATSEDGISGDWMSGLASNLGTEMVGALITYVLFEMIIGGQEKRKQLEEKVLETGHQRSTKQAELLAELFYSETPEYRQLILDKMQLLNLLEGANFESLNLQNAILIGCNLRDAKLMNTKLQNATLIDTDFQSADMMYTNLEQANLENANLKQALLLGANLKGADLRDTKFDEETILPDAEIIANENGNHRFDKHWNSHTDMTCYTDPNNPNFWQPSWVTRWKNNKRR